VPLLINKDVSLLMRGKLYTSCVRSYDKAAHEEWPTVGVGGAALMTFDWQTVRNFGGGGGTPDHTLSKFCVAFPVCETGEATEFRFCA